MKKFSCNPKTGTTVPVIRDTVKLLVPDKCEVVVGGTMTVKTPRYKLTVTNPN